MPQPADIPRRTRAEAKRLGCKTAAQWYQEDHRITVKDPDGWRTQTGWWDYWNLPITKLEYESRIRISTCTAYDPDRHEHFMRPNPPPPRQWA